MGEAELVPGKKLLLIRSVFFFYGNAATGQISRQTANDIEQHWNQPGALVHIQHNTYRLLFDIKGHYTPHLSPGDVFGNTNPQNNYFRIEETSPVEVSFVDGIGCNTGFLLLKNLLQDSTTAAHEYGHTLGLQHPAEHDIRGRGVPGIMYPRGTIVDAVHQYNRQAVAGDNFNGGTINPLSRKVMQQDIDQLKLYRLRFNKQGFATVGEFSSLWHEMYQ